MLPRNSWVFRPSQRVLTPMTVNLQFIDWGLAPRAALGVLALLSGNGYIVGINQIYDVDIDTINKPFLPVAAGMPAAWMHACPLRTMLLQFFRQPKQSESCCSPVSISKSWLESSSFSRALA